MRKEFEMTEEQLQRLYAASQPVTYMVIGGVPPRSPQENANAAWKQLGREMGFNYLSVRPIPQKGDRFFTAEESKQEESNAKT